MCCRPPCDQLEQVLRTCGTVLYPHLHAHTRRQLRLVCKAACDVVDANTRCLTFVGKTNGRTALSVDYPGRPNTKSLQLKQPRPLATQAVIAHTLLYKSLGTYTMGFDFSSSLPPRLQRLCLTDCLTWPLGDSLAPLTSFASTLQHLTLSYNKLCNAASCTALAGVLSTLTSLTHLHMERNLMQELLALALAPALPALTQLTRLELVEEDASESTPQLLRAITGLPQLQHPRLYTGARQRWGDEAPAWDSTSLDVALGMLERLPSLTFLDPGQDCGAMCCTHEVDIPTARVVSGSASSRPSIRMMMCSWAEAKGLSRSTKASSGSICHDMQGLCKAVAAVSTLTSLHLNHLRLEGNIGLLAAHFPAALFPAPVRTLSLVNCHLTGHGEQLCQALSALPGITSLDLSENRFTWQDWQHLNPMLACATRLQQLYMQRVRDVRAVQPVQLHRETPGADAPSDALPHLFDLRVLNLENSIHLAEGAARLLPAIRRLGASLEELDLQWCFLGACDEKQEAVPALTQVWGWRGVGQGLEGKLEGVARGRRRCRR